MADEISYNLAIKRKQIPTVNSEMLQEFVA